MIETLERTPLYAEHVVRGEDSVTTFFCDACHTEWDEREAGRPIGPTRTRLPKTRRNKESEN